MKRLMAVVLAVGLLFAAGQAGDAPRAAGDVYVFPAVKADPVVPPAPAPAPNPPAPSGPVRLKVEVGSYVSVCVKTDQKMRVKVRDASLFDTLKLEKGQFYGGKPFGESTHKNVKFDDAAWVMLAVKAGTTDVVVDANGPDGPETKFEAFIEVFDPRVPVVDPVKPVGPALPDGKFGLAKFAYDAAKSQVQTEWRGQAKSLAAAYRRVASAKGVSTPVDLLKAAKREADAAATPAKWEAFGVALQEKLWGLYEAKKLNVTDDFRTALSEVADGLEQVGG
jgi:hypothetical protein